jgi:hypothetical protein
MIQIPGTGGYLLLVSWIVALAPFGSAADFYVSPSGDDGNPGSMASPWRTVQKAADTVPAGSNVYLREGIYEEKVEINVSGSMGGGFITFQPAPGEKAIIDGSNLPFDANNSNALIAIYGQSYLRIEGLELRNFRTARRYLVPVGILIEGDGSHIEILNNRIHDIETLFNGLDGGDAHGIGLFGYETNPLEDILISGNELYDLKLGSSEALVLNGNVRNFEVSNNVVRDCNNIGIDFIGFEGNGPTPALDQARDGVCRGNLVFNINSAFNPAYGGSFSKGGGDTSAGGIYVDGGTRILVEQNVVHHCNIGIELASEHAGRSTSEITVRNNLVYHNDIGGLFLGGYDRRRGMTRDCVVLNNTFYQNDTRRDGNGEIYLQFDVEDCEFRNNLLVANGQGLLIGNPYTENANNVLNHNLFFAPNGAQEWQWKRTFYTNFSTYQSASGNDAGSLLANPQLVDAANQDFRLSSGSPARNAGNPAHPTGTGEEDFFATNRIEEGRIDIGAIEYRAGNHGAVIDATGLGQAIANGDPTPDLLDGTDFGEVVWKDGVPVERDFRITNSGSAPFRPVDFSLSQDGNPFFLSGTFASIPAGESRLLTLTFSPANGGAKIAEASLQGRFSGNNRFFFAIAGEGAAPDFLPDLQVGTKASTPTGKAIYDRAQGQKLSHRIKRHTGLVYFRAENAGAETDQIRLIGTGKNRFFTPRYDRIGGTTPGNATGLILSGGEIANLGSAGNQLYRLRIKVSRRVDGRKKRRTFRVRGTSENASSESDQALAAVKTQKR